MLAATAIIAAAEAIRPPWRGSEGLTKGASRGRNTAQHSGVGKKHKILALRRFLREYAAKHGRKGRGMIRLMEMVAPKADVSRQYFHDHWRHPHSSWGLMIMGFGALGATLRRRRAAVVA